MGLPEKQSVFKVAYEQITGYLEGGPPPHCSGADNLAVNEIAFATIESGLTGRKVDTPCQNRGRKIWAK